MNKNFKIGDRIKVVKKGEGPMYSQAVVGDVGEIIAEREAIIDAKRWLVRFDTPRKFYHTGGGRCEPRRGYWCTPDMLQRIDMDEKIIITTDGTTTTARRYKGKELLGSAEAKCSPADTFDFEYGARLAFGRLLGKGAISFDMKKLAEAIKKNQPKINAELNKVAERLCDSLKGLTEPKTEPKPEPKFKVDDLVVVVGNGHDIRHSIPINSLAVVVKVDKARESYDYRCVGGTTCGLLKQWIHESDLEKYEKGE